MTDAEALSRRIRELHGIEIPAERVAGILPIVSVVEAAVRRAAAEMAFEDEASGFLRELETER